MQVRQVGGDGKFVLAIGGGERSSLTLTIQWSSLSLMAGNHIHPPLVVLLTEGGEHFDSRPCARSRASH